MSEDTPEQARERVARIQNGLPALAAQHRSLARSLSKPGGYAAWVRDVWGVDVPEPAGDFLGHAMSAALLADAESLEDCYSSAVKFGCSGLRSGHNENGPGAAVTAPDLARSPRRT